MTSLRNLRAPTIAVVVLALVWACLVVAVVFQQMADSRVDRELKDLKLDMARNTEQAITYRKVTGSYEELSSKLGVRYREASWGRQMPYMVNQLTGIAQSHEVNIETVKPDTMTSANGIYRFPLRVSFKAGLADMVSLIREVETASPILDIEQLNIHSSGDQSDQLEADMLVCSFAIVDEYAPEISEIEPADGKSPSASAEPGPSKKAETAQGAGPGRQRGTQ